MMQLQFPLLLQGPRNFDRAVMNRWQYLYIVFHIMYRYGQGHRAALRLLSSQVLSCCRQGHGRAAAVSSSWGRNRCRCENFPENLSHFSNFATTFTLVWSG